MTYTDVDWAWAAGLFEGEGAIVFCAYTDGTNRWHRDLRISMCDEDVLQRFAAIVGVGKVTPVAPRKDKPHWKPQFIWYVNAWPNIVAVLSRFLPHLGLRRRAKAEALLASPPQLDPSLNFGRYGRDIQSHCKRGHPLRGEGADVYWWHDIPHCRTCWRIRYQERQRAKHQPDSVAS
jgi:hypothetical protein